MLLNSWSTMELNDKDVPGYDKLFSLRSNVTDHSACIEKGHNFDFNVRPL